MTTRTLTVQPRDGHFTTREDWAPHELPGLLRRYRRVLRGTDGGWINAFGWCNIGIDAYLADYYPHTRDQRTIISLGGFSAEEFVTLVDKVNAAVPAGEIAAVEFNVSCHNVNFDFSTILQDVLDEAVPRSSHPVILKLSPDYDYLRNARQAAKAGVAALTAINTVKALRLDPRTGTPWLANRYGGLSGRAIKPIAPAGGGRAARRRGDAADHRHRRHPDGGRLPGVLLGGRRRGEPRQRDLARELPRLRPLAAARAAGPAGARRGAPDVAAAGPRAHTRRPTARCDPRRNRAHRAGAGAQRRARGPRAHRPSTPLAIEGRTPPVDRPPPGDARRCAQVGPRTGAGARRVARPGQRARRARPTCGNASA